MNDTLKLIKTKYAIPAAMGGDSELIELVDKTDVAMSLHEYDNARLRGSLEQLAGPWNDKEAPNDKEIDAEFPTRSQNHGRFQRAADLVQPRRSKYALIALVNWLLARAEKAEARHTEPIPMVLHCPFCGAQHIDEPKGEWTNPPHRSHKCSSCLHIWRPADVHTVGVAEVKTKGKNDSESRTRRIPDKVSGHVITLTCQEEKCGARFLPSNAVIERGFYRCPSCGYPGQ